MSDQIVLSLEEVVKMLKDQIFLRIAQISTEERFHKSLDVGHIACRGGAAIGIKPKKGDQILFVSEINSNLPDYWGDEGGYYSAYAAMKVITALQSERPTVNTGEEFSFSHAVHKGAVPLYLKQYDAWVAIGFSGFESDQDDEITTQALKEFFQDMS